MDTLFGSALRSLWRVCRNMSLLTGMLCAFSPAALADSAIGNWLRPTNGAHITVYDCGGGLGMKVASAPEPENVGKTIMCGAQPTAGNKWQGDILNLDNGKTYSGYVELRGDSLLLSGCLLGGILCKTETWSRIK